MYEKSNNLKRLLSPKSIAFIGTHDIIKQGIDNAIELGFNGEIFAVHQTRDDISGIRCFKNIEDLPLSLDAAYVAVRAEVAVEVIEQLWWIGTAGCVCYAAGFAEKGEHELQNELIEAAGEMALVGPNCYGLINYLDATPLWPDRHGGNQIDKGIALISQSGNLSLNLTLSDRSLPLAYAISIGNQATLEVADYIKALCDDERVTAIGLHIEGLRDIESFMKAAKIALEKQIPIVALKTGVSDLGSNLTMSHTSSLAGSDEFYDALFKRLKIARVNSLSSLLEALKLLSVTGPITGRSIGVLTCSGGESTMIADEADPHHIDLPALGKKQAEEISTLLTKFEHVGNPLDYNTSIWGKFAELKKCFTSFMQGPFDATLLVLDILKTDKGNIKTWVIALKAFMEAHQQVQSSAIVVSMLPEGIPTNLRDELIDCGVTPLLGITDAFTSIERAMSYGEIISNLKQELESFPTNLLMPSTELKLDETYSLNEWEGKQTIASYGVNVPNGTIVQPSDDLSFISREMTGPFVAKIVSKDIVHKSDVGGVKLFLKNEEQVIEAIDQMNKNLIPISQTENQYLIEEMIQNDVAELNIGIKRDHQFGLVLIISMGGEFVNLLNDSAVVLLPATRDDIKKALYSLKGFRLLQGYRGRPLGDIEAVLDAAQSIALFAENHCDELLEMDVNPLLVRPEGEGAIAADTYIHLINKVQYEYVL